MTEAVEPSHSLRALAGRSLSGADRAVRTLERLHPHAVRDADEILSLLERAARENTELRRGMNRRIDPELAWITRVAHEGIELRTQNFEAPRGEIFLSFNLGGQPYFVSAPLATKPTTDRLELEFPSVLYCKERRGRVRRPPGKDDPQRIQITRDDGVAIEGEIDDVSLEGLGVRLPKPAWDLRGGALDLHFIDGPRAGETYYGEVCHEVPLPQREGWTRIGMDVSPVRRGAPIEMPKREEVISTGARHSARRGLAIAGALARGAVDRTLDRVGRRTKLPEVHLVEYENKAGESLRGIVDSWGDPKDAVGVVIPPAWGRTKETLMPLAATIVAGFRKAEAPVVVLRYDGVRKRGESHNEPGCRAPGTEHHRFTFSQGVRDIEASLDYLEKGSHFQLQKLILVSFSVASIEARRVTATDPRVAGWVAVVGAPDLQSMLHVISGGIDYAAGYERGVRFGLQEILGIEVDLDIAAGDAFAHDLVFLDDARRDMARIHQPLTWIRGQHDRWMNIDRIQDMLSRGDTRGRRYIEVPTGHMLKTSTEALETFELVTAEVSRMALGTEIRGARPDLAELDRRSRAERERLPRRDEDLQGFWRDYLVGRNGALGFELMTSISPYEELMEQQVQALQLVPGMTVADLGSGTGAFPMHVAQQLPDPESLRILSVDYVSDALQRGRQRLATQERVPSVAYVTANLDTRRGGISFPIAAESVDAILGALFLSYVKDPVAVLREMRGILRPGGRLVVSTLRRDADMSKLYMEGLEELAARGLGDLDAGDGSEELDALCRDYFSQAARLLDLEEQGTFRFYDDEEIQKLLVEAGFTDVTSLEALGDPPQAIVAAGIKAGTGALSRS